MYTHHNGNFDTGCKGTFKIKNACTRENLKFKLRNKI